MRLSIAQFPDTTFTIEVDDSMELENLQALLEMESEIPVSNQQLLHDGHALSGPKLSLKALGLKSGDMVYLSDRTQQAPPPPPVRPPPPSASSGQANPQVEAMRQRVLRDPQLLRQLTQVHPEIERAARTDPSEFARIIAQLEEQRQSARAQQMREVDALNADPFDIEAQRRIEEAIRKENIDRNMEAALELNPESFASVTMLYIDVEVNNMPVKAFVDSGAQATIMSPVCAERCGIMRLLDTRFAGMAKGVGMAKILGRVHNAQMKVGSQFLVCSFTVMEGRDVDLLFGLDMLKRHQACIDLKQNALVINGEKIEFLPEHLIPKMAVDEEALAAAASAAGSSSSANPHTAPAPSAASAAGGMATSSRTTAQYETQPQPSQQQPRYSEETIQTIMSFGVSRAEAISALDAADGNPDVAASFLFS